MLERIVENWLSRAGERGGFETPFAQLLSLEGHRVLHGPVHHPFEHGKDIASFDPDGRLCAFQLKAGDLALEAINDIQGQLIALADGAVTYPGVTPPRRPDRPTLVVGGSLTPPARDRIQNLNAARASAGSAVIELVEKEQLIARFVAAHGSYMPAEPADLSSFLRFLLSDGKGPLPVRDLCLFLEDMHSPPGRTLTVNQQIQAFASSIILTAYVVAPWERTQNHQSVAEGWLTVALQVLRVASERDMEDDLWAESFDLAVSAARRSLATLLDECDARKDLILPDLVEGAVYGTRALQVCGYLAAFCISEKALGALSDARRDSLRRVLLREEPFIRVSGEVGAPYVIAVGTALEVLGEVKRGRQLVGNYAAGVAKKNLPRSGDAIPDPYHTFEETLLMSLGFDTPADDERFAGHSYSLHVCSDWFARRGERTFLARIWPDVTRIQLCEMQVSKPSRYLRVVDEDGELSFWFAGAPQSFRSLREAAAKMKESALPPQLWRRAEYLPYVPLVLPHRLTASLAKAVDYVASANVEVE